MSNKKYHYVRRTARWEGRQYEATGKTVREAEQKLAEKLAAAKRGEDVIHASMTVDAWYHQWMELYKRPKGLTAKSLAMYEEKYRLYIKPRIGRMKLADVRAAHLQKIINEQAGMSSSHVCKLRLVMQGMFARARQSRLIVYDPSELLELPATTRHQRRPITDAEREAILAVADQHRAGLWVLTLLYTGMRPGETAALSWADVDFSRNEIHVHAAKESGSATIKGPKTAAGVRDIPMRPALAQRLREAQWKPFSPVFPTQRGTRQTDSSMRRMWDSFMREVGELMGGPAPELSPYCLRHTFCSDLQRAGVPINIAKELMGHADIQTTANIYTHRNNDTLHDALAQLDISRHAGISAGKNISSSF